MEKSNLFNHINILDKFKKEAELFFVTEFLGYPSLTPSKQILEFEYCLDLLFDLKKDSQKDYSKGVAAISGSYGQGKSFLFEVAHHLHLRETSKQLFTRVTAKYLVQVYQNGGEDALNMAIKAKNLFIDDIGDEGEKKEFAYSKGGFRQGTLNVLRYVILRRYEMWSSKGYKTHLTSNLSLENIAKQYDGRAADRIAQMCDIRDFTFLKDNGSFRQTKKARKLSRDEVLANIDKLYPKKQNAEIDKKDYLIKLANSQDNYIYNVQCSVWKVVMLYMLQLKIVVESDLVPSDEIKGQALGIAKIDTIALVNLKYKYAPENIKQYQKKLALERIKTDYIEDLAKWLKAKEIFMQMRKEGKFGTN